MDDQQLVRTGFRMILADEPDIEVVGEAKDGAQALERSADRARRRRHGHPDADHGRRRGDPPDRRRARHPEPRADPHDVRRRRVRRRGAPRRSERDSCSRTSRRTTSGQAIRTIAAGDALLAPSVTRQLLDRFRDRLPAAPGAADARLAELTDRELEVLKLVARGLSNREIAERLVLAEPTVKTHVSHMLLKLDLRDRAQAVVLAYEAGLVRPGGAGGLTLAPSGRDGCRRRPSPRPATGG